MPRTKFPDGIASLFWAMSLDGGADREAGDSSEQGRWYGLIQGPWTTKELIAYAETDEEYEIADTTHVRSAAGIILTEDSQGFVDYELFHSQKQMDRVWDEIEAEFAGEEE